MENISLYIEGARKPGRVVLVVLCNFYVLEMYRLAKFVWDYFHGEKEDGVLKRLESNVDVEDFIVDIESNKKINFLEQVAIKHEECKEKIGIITQLETNFGMIDHKLRFNIDAAPGLDLAVNNVVQYLLYQKQNGEILVKRIVSIQHDLWDGQIDHTKTSEATTLERALDIHTRTIIVKVLFRCGRILKLSDDNMDCNLDDVDSNFVPMVGDVIVLDAKVTSDEKNFNFDGETLEYYKLRPCLSAVQEYIITSYDIHNCRGVAGDEVYFYKDSFVDANYEPSVGDKVIIESIQSEQGVYNYRAVSLVRTENGQSQVMKQNVHVLDAIQHLCEPKNNLSISKCKFEAKTLGEQAVLVIAVHNKGAESQIIQNANFYLQSKDFQLKVIFPRWDKKIEVRPGKYAQYKIKAEAKFYGYSKELLVFTFKDFKMGSYINISVGIEDGPRAGFHRPLSTVQERSNKLRDNRLLGEVDFVPGRRLVRAPAFVCKKLPAFTVPDHLADAVIGKTANLIGFQTILDSILVAAPYLKQDLNQENYRNVFHSLLYLNEIDEDLKMRQYDMDRAHFTHVQGYLALEIDNLSERRPSLMIGDHVIAISAVDQTKTPYQGYIHKVLAKHIWLRFIEDFHSNYNGQDYVVKFHSSRTSYRRCHQAIDLAFENVGGEILFVNKVTKIIPKINFKIVNGDLYFRDENKLKMQALKEKTNVSKKKQELCTRLTLLANLERSQQQKTAEKCESEGVLDETWKQAKWFNQKLNELQKEAVKNVLLGEARPIPYVIFGPPGTGKSITVVETIVQILTLITDSRILLATPSNSSADLLTSRLVEYGLQPGEMVRVVAHHLVDNNSIPVNITPYCATVDIAREGTRESLVETLESGIRLSIPKTHLSRHRLVIGTCICLGQLHTMSFPLGHFTHVVVDEAGQATEPEIMVPLAQIKKDKGQIVLAGDPMQLGPIVSSTFANHLGLGNSFLSRILDRYPYQRDPEGFPETGGYLPQLVTRLTYNYRSVPEILKLSSDMFYDSELIPMTSQIDGPEAEILQSLSDLLPVRAPDVGPPSVIFHGVQGRNEQTIDSPSWFNKQEAGQVLCFLVKLYKKNVKPEDIGIITPYQKQVHYLRTIINNLDIPEPKIGSVEEFQGQEKSIIIISTVRSKKILLKNDIVHSLGFVQSPKRLNVSITRAKSLLVIFGNPHLLANDEKWCRVIKYCVDIGGYIGCDLPSNLLNLSEIYN